MTYIVLVRACYLCVGMLYPRHSGGAVPLRFLVESAITVVTPQLLLKVSPYPSHMCFFFAVLLPNQGRITAVLEATLRGQSGATTGLAVLLRCYCAGAGAAGPLHDVGAPAIWDVVFGFRWCRRVSRGYFLARVHSQINMHTCANLVPIGTAVLHISLIFEYVTP